MEVIYLDEKVDFSKERTVIGLGNFDGFHKGHIHLLKEIKNISKKNALISSLLIFRTHTDEIFNKKDYKYLSFLSDKFEILKNFGIDRVFVKSFDVDFSNKTKEEFLKFLTEELGVFCIVVGDDYTFGRNAEGNVEWLEKNKEKYKLETGIVSQLKIGEILVKTSQIKEFLWLACGPFTPTVRPRPRPGRAHSPRPRQGRCPQETQRPSRRPPSPRNRSPSSRSPPGRPDKIGRAHV